MSYPEALNFLTPAPGGGGFEGVPVDRTFENPNGIISTLQLYRVHQFIPEDHSGTTFRFKKPVVLEEVAFLGGEDVSKEVAGQMQSRKYTWMVEQLHGDTEAHDADGAKHSAGGYRLTQFLWRLVKGALREKAERGDKIVPLLLKFREHLERGSYYAMMERKVDFPS
jgi:hypothetical protein